MDLEYKLKLALQSKDELKINSVFEEIYHDYGKLVFFCISKYVSNRMDIEELTNDVFISFFNRLGNITELRSIKYYLTTSAKNTAIDFLKKKKIDTVYMDELFLDKEEEVSSSISYQKIIKQMKEILSEKEVEIILNHQLYGMQFKEIAEEMSMSANTVKSIYRRAIKKIQQKYKGGKNNE